MIYIFIFGNNLRLKLQGRVGSVLNLFSGFWIETGLGCGRACRSAKPRCNLQRLPPSISLMKEPSREPLSGTTNLGLTFPLL
ncbi:hypothetical protein Prudu_022758 [Prunus dulcis]|uniref:Uncharacterized protein n=1 Tax=Prunus dulcis TaxID=3755 RepID=A0A4Y1S1P6_PRUDU|nr:hypothetical protein Prudu_022758 [Prunus dulcis]